MSSYNCSSALPAVFKRELQSQESDEGDSVTLHCELSKPGVPVVWKKGTQVLKSGEKYLIMQDGATVELKITDLRPEDAGQYTCVCGDKKTTANIKIKGMKLIWSVQCLFFHVHSLVSTNTFYIFTFTG